MSRNKIALAIMALAMTLVLSGGALQASGPGLQAEAGSFVYRALIPLGNETFQVQPWKRVLTVMASAGSPSFAGWRRQPAGRRWRLLDAGGQPVRYYPRDIDFRVSVGTRTHLDGADPFPLRTEFAENDYLLKLRFRVKIFHGLRKTVVEPASVELIGVPSDIPYEERIYHMSFALPAVSIADRMVLEVLTPSGERLCKFHLDLE